MPAPTTVLERRREPETPLPPTGGGKVGGARTRWLHISVRGVLVHHLTSAPVLWLTGAMPNLVVYVPARLARSLEAIGVSEDLQRRACREVLVGLADGELGAGEPEAATSPAGGGSRPAVRPPAPSRSSKRSFRPDPKGGSGR